MGIFRFFNLNLMAVFNFLSAGVGLTGTYLAIEPLMERISDRKSVNVFRRVFEIRKNRTGFVQNPVIKKYCYLFIRNYFKLTLFF